jgi:hypothetical protein
MLMLANFLGKLASLIEGIFIQFFHLHIQGINVLAEDNKTLFQLVLDKGKQASGHDSMHSIDIKDLNH